MPLLVSLGEELERLRLGGGDVAARLEKRLGVRSAEQLARVSHAQLATLGLKVGQRLRLQKWVAEHAPSATTSPATLQTPSRQRSEDNGSGGVSALYRLDPPTVLRQRPISTNFVGAYPGWQK